MPLSPGNPWLLAFALSVSADPIDHLAPAAPIVALHPAPLTAPGSVTLRFRSAAAVDPPLLSALPSLRQ